ncbi:hypothetical protein EJV46_10075 [Roseococcus sp. SYP-B2431]|uniref:hypothetical protein n=1 Tax=Roseococcus sp. SYP-B2431 TaxID=2496640 RepID=UPI001040CC6D|nr:hypothetical protein [Roseococcus sp. SYP-B2431]TCH98894.1 hypothetical protein EJV46_10075 [Roseococcus sp. SYP-B2431]
MRWLLVLPVSAIAVLPIQSDRPLRMTTESAEYCRTLAARLAETPQATAELPRGLGEEGRHLCSIGHYRSGIARLRRAIRAAQAEPRRS